MRIRYNQCAMNASRNLNIVWKRQAGLVEKLSTGYSINRASDNPAGFKISEKMRAQIRGLERASQNAQDAISLLQTADGALDEVHSILQRVRELAVQGANDTNVTADRKSIQEELDQLLKEVDRIGGTTEFNTKRIFAKDKSGAVSASPYKVAPKNEGVLFSYGENHEGWMEIYEKDFGYDIVSTPGSEVTMSGYDSIKTALKEQIVPQAVNTIMNAYPSAFGYLQDFSTGIGLEFYNDSSDSALAYAHAGLGRNGSTYTMEYRLSINLARVDLNGENLTKFGRRELEGTVLHEMVHAFMFEATTNGMYGMNDSGSSSTQNVFPDWFIEGMAQTGVGGYATFNDWVRSGLGITTSTSVDRIKTIVKSTQNRLTNRSSSRSAYGTGYLAATYLGMVASGKEITTENVTQANIRSGLDSILNSIVSGTSLDQTIREVSGGKYQSTADFELKFGDDDSAQFIQYLTAAVGTGNGSIVAQSLTAKDLLPDVDASSSVFQLDTTRTNVTNMYPNEIRVTNGGAKSTNGTAPIANYTRLGEDSNTPSGTQNDITAKIADGNLLTVTHRGVSVSGNNGLHIQVGANEGQSMELNIGEVSTTKLGIDKISVMSYNDASNAIDAVDKAITEVSSIRSRIGAYQNRLEFTIENLDNTAENLQAAESRIRDLDMAKAMVEYAKNQILIQAGQSILAQSNQSTQGVLKLLQM